MKVRQRIPWAIRKARKLGFYAMQKALHYRFDAALEANLTATTRRILSGECPASLRWSRRSLAEFSFNDQARYKIFAENKTKGFEAAANGPEHDAFGRKGKWKTRGVLIHLDVAEDLIIKTFPPRFSAIGEGRFIEEALAAGFYDHLCPLLDCLIHDSQGQLVGYAIKRGRLLTRFEFERYVGVVLRPLICEATTRSGFYFYDLTDHNVIVRDGVISLIDLESVLPVEWFGKPPGYAASNLHIIDTGWPIQNSWKSPEWYAAHLRALQAGLVTKPGLG